MPKPGYKSGIIMIIEEEQAINLYPVDDTAGLTRDLIINTMEGRR